MWTDSVLHAMEETGAMEETKTGLQQASKGPANKHLPSSFLRTLR